MNIEKEFPYCFEQEVAGRKMAITFLGISSVTFWKLEKSGKIKSTLIGNRKFYRLPELKAISKTINKK